MRVEIETYRGWKIEFNTDTEEFYAMSNDWDKDINKKSYASTKKFIDDYIKDNTHFKPVKIEKLPSIYGEHEIVTLIGIRKDKRFNIETKSGKKTQLSEYDEKSWFLYNPDNKKHFDKIDELKKERQQIDDKIKEEEKLINKVTVDEYKKTLEL